MKPLEFSVPVGRKRVNVTLERRVSSGPWHCRFWWKNKPHWKSTKLYDVRAAKAFAFRHVESIASAQPVDESPIDALITLYESAKWPGDRNNNRSYTSAHNQLMKFKAHADGIILGGLTFDETRDLLQDFFDKLKATIAAVTVDGYRRVISGFFTWLIQRRRVTYHVNPAGKKGLILPKMERRIKAPASEDKIQKLLKVAAKDEIYPALILLMAIGMRRTGLNGLHWRDIDFKQRTIKLHEKNRDRIVPLSKWAISELKPLKQADAAPVLPIHVDNFSHRLRRLKKRAQVADLTVIALRRAFLKKMFDAKVSPQLAARIAGNSIGVIVKHYVDLETMDATDAVDVVDYSKAKRKP